MARTQTGRREKVAIHGKRTSLSASPDQPSGRGKYRVEGSTFTIAVDASWNESWNGTKQRRHFKIDGDRLSIETDPGPSIRHPGKNAVARLVFEREK